MHLTLSAQFADHHLQHPNESDALPLVLDVGRIHPLRSHYISSALSAPFPAKSSPAAPALVRLVELQWDMQTGNFLGESLDVIKAASTQGSNAPKCLSALIASGSRCLKVYKSPPRMPHSTFSLHSLSDSLQIRPFIVSLAHLSFPLHRIHILFRRKIAHCHAARHIFRQRARSFRLPRGVLRIPAAAEPPLLSRVLAFTCVCSHIQGIRPTIRAKNFIALITLPLSTTTASIQRPRNARFSFWFP